MATSDLNTVALIGNLTRDAELTYLNTGTAVVKCSIAVNRSKKEGDQWVSEANFFDVSYFGKGAEGIKQYLSKGKKIAVQGSLRQDRWEKDGQRFSRVYIVADNVELLGGRSDGGDSFQSTGSSGGYQQRPAYSSNPSNNGGYTPSDSGESFGGNDDGFPEDIPF